jgi:hypothetical protein
MGFAQQIAHTSPTPVGAGPTPIHPLDVPYPIDIITPAAANIGTLTLRFYEIYNKKVWDDLPNLNGKVDITDIFYEMAARAPVNMVKLIRPPKLNTREGKNYFETYHNVKITNVEDGELIEVGTMEIMKTITVAYTHMTRNGKKSQTWRLGDLPKSPR